MRNQSSNAQSSSWIKFAATKRQTMGHSALGARSGIERRLQWMVVLLLLLLLIGGAAVAAWTRGAPGKDADSSAKSTTDKKAERTPAKPKKSDEKWDKAVSPLTTKGGETKAKASTEKDRDNDFAEEEREAN